MFGSGADTISAHVPAFKWDKDILVNKPKNITIGFFQIKMDKLPTKDKWFSYLYFVPRHSNEGETGIETKKIQLHSCFKELTYHEALSEIWFFLKEAIAVLKYKFAICPVMVEDQLRVVWSKDTIGDFSGSYSNVAPLKEEAIEDILCVQEMHEEMISHAELFFERILVVDFDELGLGDNMTMF
jgi:hypothetical protein